MKRFAQMMVFVAAGGLLAACNFFTQPADLQTENLQNELAQTQIAAVRATATMNADQILITLESAQTAVAAVNLQSTRIASTLIAGGMSFVDASLITPEAPVAEAPTQNPNSLPQIANPLLTPGAAQGDSQLSPATQPAEGVQPTSAPGNSGSTGLSNITVTDQVGSDDCPIGSQSSFSSTTAEIYVTAVGNGIASTATLDSIWRMNGTDIQTYTWSPGFAVNGACIWFRLPSSEVEFTPGNWSVELLVDGVSAGSPTPFTITSDTPTEIDLDS